MSEAHHLSVPPQTESELDRTSPGHINKRTSGPFECESAFLQHDSAFESCSDDPADACWVSSGLLSPPEDAGRVSSSAALPAAAGKSSSCDSRLSSTSGFVLPTLHEVTRAGGRLRESFCSYIFVLPGTGLFLQMRPAFICFTLTLTADVFLTGGRSAEVIVWCSCWNQPAGKPELEKCCQLSRPRDQTAAAAS